MNKALILFIATILGYGNTLNKHLSNPEPEVSIIEEEPQNSILLGDFQKDDLLKKPFSKWFQPNYERFTPNAEAMKKIENNIHDYEIKLFMGTWCADSRRETPKFLKLLDLANFNYDNIEMIAVDYDKTTESGEEIELGIEYVPTIIFYKNGKEVNRFVEYPRGESIEEDIAKIVTGELYNNSYAN